MFVFDFGMGFQFKLLTSRHQHLANLLSAQQHLSMSSLILTTAESFKTPPSSCKFALDTSAVFVFHRPATAQ